jgi:1,4-alpha-glucan branching enzyme
VIKRQKPTKAGTVKLTFELPVSEPEGPVSVVGDFNDWQPGVHELVPGRNGSRTATVTVPAGTTLRFRYLADGGRWFDDDNADARDEHGCLVSV